MGAPDQQTPNTLGTRAQSITDVSLSLGKEKPVANEKAQPPEGFRQGSLPAYVVPGGVRGRQARDGAGSAERQPPWAWQTTAFIVFHEDYTVTTSQTHSPSKQGNPIPLEILA